MLLRFIFENFLSYRDRTIFSMAAGKVTRHWGHVCECNGQKLLRSAFIFGANAGGKSNFVKALDFGRRLVVEGGRPLNMDKLHFRLGDCQNRVGSFQYDLFTEGKFYSYGFAINYDNSSIVEEWLSQIDSGREISIFHRTHDERDGTQIATELSLPSEDKTRFNVYATDFRSREMRKELFIRDVAKRAGNATEFGRDAASVLRWFSNLLIIFPETRYSGVPSFMVDRKKNDTFSHLLAHFDTGIESLVDEEIDVEKFWERVPPDIRGKLKADVIRDLTSGKGNPLVTVNDGRSTYMFAYSKGRITVRKTSEDHGNRNELFERSEESDGTNRLFDLIPLYENWRNGRVVVIDEIDRSLHTKATLEFVRLFLDDLAAKKAQLIATTHDGGLLDLDVLRQDEIWFAERAEDKHTSLYSLLKFKARFDKDILKDYLLGRYGALPVFDWLNKEEGGE